jgi:hypothetical protein
VEADSGAQVLDLRYRPVGTAAVAGPVSRARDETGAAAADPPNPLRLRRSQPTDHGPASVDDELQLVAPPPTRVLRTVPENALNSACPVNGAS